MPARPVWKGQLRLSLVSIPVELYTATQTGAKIAFRQIHEPTGKPVRYEKIVHGHGPVDPDEIMKGFEYEKDEYVLIDPDEIDAIKLETKKTMELVQFVGGCEIPPLWFNKPYYLVPADDLAEDAYRVVRDALRQSGKVGIGQITLRGREHLAAVKPSGDGLLLETLYYADEIKDADPLFADIEDDEADKELLEVATALIDKKTAPFDPAAYKDNYTIALRELVESKTKNKKTKKVSASDDEDRPDGENVVDLMAALKKSLQGADAKQTTTKAPAKKKPAPKKKAG